MLPLLNDRWTTFFGVREGMSPVVPVFRCSLAWLGHLFFAALAVHRRKLCQGVRSYTSDSHRDDRELRSATTWCRSVSKWVESICCTSAVADDFARQSLTCVDRVCRQSSDLSGIAACRFSRCHHVRRDTGESGEKKYLPFTAISHECVPDVVLLSETLNRCVFKRIDVRCSACAAVVASCCWPLCVLCVFYHGKSVSCSLQCTMRSFPLFFFLG